MKSEWDEAGFRSQVANRVKAAPLPIALEPQAYIQFALYYQLLSKWNHRINLTALPLDRFPARTIDRLLVEPLVAAEFIPNAAGLWIDLGSGGGSPAIPLKIVRPAVKLMMVESRSRKAAFLREVSATLKLDGVSVLTTRIEDIPQRIGSASVDVVTMRAVKLDDEIAAAVASVLHPAGRFLLFAARVASNVAPSVLRARSASASSGVGGHSDRGQSAVGGPSERGQSSLAARFRELQRRELPDGGGELTVLEKL